MNKIKEIPLAHIVYAGEREAHKDLDGLVAAMQARGQLQPIGVYHKENAYHILYGRRRFLAAQRLAWEAIAATIYPAEKLDEYDALEIELMENVQREDLTWHERDVSVARLDKLMRAKRMGTGDSWSMRKTAELMGMALGSVATAIKMAESVEAFPRLREAKTRSEAERTLNTIVEAAVLAESAQRARARGDTPLTIQEQQQVLTDSVAGIPQPTASQIVSDKQCAAQRRLINAYLVSDLLEALSKVDDNSFHLIEYDPPYAIDLRNVVTLDEQQRADLMSAAISEKEYRPFLANIFHTAHSKLRPNGWLLVWIAFGKWQNMAIEELRDAGFEVNPFPAIWVKLYGNSRSPSTTLAPAYECFLYARKGQAILAKPGRDNTFIYKALHASAKVHPTEKPIELYEEILRTFCFEGNSVCTGFAGSGNFMLAAANCKLPVIGIDKADRYKDAYTMKVVSGVPGTYKSPNRKGDR